MNRFMRASITLASLVIFSLPWSPVQAQSGHPLLGGSRGVVHDATGGLPLEGIMVQLISPRTAIRTTVYTDTDGRYEFPRLDTGEYTLRIARPMEFHPYVRDSVRIEGATQIPEIVLERIVAGPESQILPADPAIAAQLTGTEWLMSLSGTAAEKRAIVKCSFCHNYAQIFRNRYDEQGWSLILDRMMRGAGSPLIHQRPELRYPEDKALLANWLGRIRGPQSEEPQFTFLPRPWGKATRAIITEYQLPRLHLATHDIWGDSQGYLWYSPHRSPYVGRLDPKTGVVKEYRVPSVPGVQPGMHWLYVDKNDIVWMSDNWAHQLVRLDPQTEEIRRIPLEGVEDITLNTPMGGNHAVDHDGYIWKCCRDHAVVKIDPDTGKIVQRYPTKKFDVTYGSAISLDGKYFGGGSWPDHGVVLVDIEKGEVIELDTPTPGVGPARGYFDPEGNYWAAGRTIGMMVKANPKTRRITEYPLPIPYSTLYNVIPDKNGEVWAGVSHAGRVVRFNPRTEKWIEYALPEPYSHDRQAWIDNSTDPVTFWYVDHEGFIVRVQPLE